MFNQSHRKPSQAGQTLIETLVAAFVLIMGISAALGLATYSLSTTGRIKQQTIAMGLAREGIEVVKNMRDTNWLRGTLSTTCYDYLQGGQNTYCFQDWLSAQYDLDPNSTTSNPSQAFVPLPVPEPNTRPYALYFTPGATETPWSLTPSAQYGLDVSTEVTNHGIYYYPSSGPIGNSQFYRKIIISVDDFAPFDRSDHGPRVTVTSKVWWWGKNCPEVTDMIEGDTNPCMITLQTYLTNWRNFP